MSTEPPRPLPQGAIQATGQVASDVVGSLKNQPAMLTLVVLNVIGLMVAGWFLSSLIDSAKEQRAQLFKMVEKCIGSNTSLSNRQDAKK